MIITLIAFRPQRHTLQEYRVDFPLMCLIYHHYTSCTEDIFPLVSYRVNRLELITSLFHFRFRWRGSLPLWGSAHGSVIPFLAIMETFRVPSGGQWPRCPRSLSAAERLLSRRDGNTCPSSLSSTKRRFSGSGFREDGPTTENERPAA